MKKIVVKIMQVEELKLKFDGENEIELETLSKSLNHVVNVLKDIADNTLSESDYCKFKVTNIEKGSFLLTIKSLFEFSPALLPYVPTVLNCFKTMLEIKKHLKSENPKKIVQDGETVRIENNYGNIFNCPKATFNLYAKSNFNEKELSEIFKTVNDDQARTGISFEISSDHQNPSTVKFDKEEIKTLSVPLDVESFNKNVEEDIIEANVTVVKPDLYGKSKWTLFYCNFRINAEILDNAFCRRVHESEFSFASNTKMRVKMRVRYKLDSQKLPDTASAASYAVIQVINITQDGNIIEL